MHKEVEKLVDKGEIFVVYSTSVFMKDGGRREIKEFKGKENLLNYIDETTMGILQVTILDGRRRVLGGPFRV